MLKHVISLVLWLVCGAYALVGAVLGLFLLRAPIVGLPMLFGSLLIGVGLGKHRHKPAFAGTLMVLGGFLVGASAGVFGAAFSSGVSLTDAVVVGGLFFGAPPVLAGAFLISVGAGRRRATVCTEIDVMSSQEKSA